jgi:hypothetical protein
MKEGTARVSVIGLCLSMLAGVLVWGGCKEQDGAAASEVPKVKATLELAGSGLGAPTVLTFEQLGNMPMVRLDNVLMRKTHDEDTVTSWEGPALEPLLAAAQIKPGPMRLMLEAEDGYKIEATLEDMKDAIVAMKDGEGRWLLRVDEDCELKLVPPHKPGNFWIMNLVRITVEPADSAALGEP